MFDIPPSQSQSPAPGSAPVVPDPLDHMLTLVSLLGDDSANVRKAVAQRLSSVSEDSITLVHPDIVSGIVSESDTEVRVALLSASRNLPDKSSDLVMALTYALLSEELKVVTEAAECLGAMGSSASGVAPCLVWRADRAETDHERALLLGAALKVQPAIGAFVERFAPEFTHLCPASGMSKVSAVEVVCGKMLFSTKSTGVREAVGSHASACPALADVGKPGRDAHWAVLAPAALVACLSERWDELNDKGKSAVLHAFGSNGALSAPFADYLTARLYKEQSDIRIVGLMAVSEVAPHLFSHFEAELRLMMFEDNETLQDYSLGVLINLVGKVCGEQEAELRELLFSAYDRADARYQRMLLAVIPSCSPEQVLPWLVATVFEENSTQMERELHRAIARCKTGLRQSEREGVLGRVLKVVSADFPDLTSHARQLLK